MLDTGFNFLYNINWSSDLTTLHNTTKEYAKHKTINPLYGMHTMIANSDNFYLVEVNQGICMDSYLNDLPNIIYILNFAIENCEVLLG
jgi:hypothetical protein